MTVKYCLGMIHPKAVMIPDMGVQFPEVVTFQMIQQAAIHAFQMIMTAAYTLLLHKLVAGAFSPFDKVPPDDAVRYQLVQIPIYCGLADY